MVERFVDGLTDATGRGTLVTGLRAVGKTALLGELTGRAAAAGWVVVRVEATPEGSFAALAGVLARRAVLALGVRGDAGLRACGAVSSLLSGEGDAGDLATWVTGPPLPGFGDGGVLADDLAVVFEAIGEAAAECGRGVLFALDELDWLGPQELGALVGAVHRVAQRGLPVQVAGAASPLTGQLVCEVRSYGSRAFRLETIGALDDDAVAAALVVPARAAGVEIERDAIKRILSDSQGSPYVLQLYGRHVWRLAGTGGMVRECDVQRVAPEVQGELDATLFGPLYRRAGVAEARYLRAMASLGPGPQRAGDVAAALGATSAKVAIHRHRLIKKGVLLSPRQGYAAFTAPLFDRYLVRVGG